MAVAVIKETKEQSLMSKLNEVIDKGRRTCTLSSNIQNLLIKQLEHELLNHNIYLTFSTYYFNNNLSKLKVYYEKRAEEELVHAKWIINYLNNCGVKYQMPKINEVKIDLKGLEDAFDITVDLEIHTTMCINNIAEQALKEGDFTTFNWLNGNSKVEGKLILEQLEEETTSRKVAGIAHMSTDWISKQDAILEYYENI